jgi:hypothetical protein
MRRLTGFFAAGLLLPPEAVLAHHSFAAHFLMDRFVEAEGRVTDVEWVNPHAYIHIEDAAGDTWEIELG